MRYALLIYGDETVDIEATEEQTNALMAAYTAFGEQYKDKIVSSVGPLLPTNSATTVRLRDGKTLTTDGPFAETKEQLGGWYLVKCDTLDEATEIAAHIPGASNGSVEVRPIMEFE